MVSAIPVFVLLVENSNYTEDNAGTNSFCNDKYLSLLDLRENN